MSHALLGFLCLTNTGSFDMNKAERKRRAAELKRKAKLAKRAKRLEAAKTRPVAANDAPLSDGGDVASDAAGETPAADAGGTPAPRADRMSTPQLSLQDEVHMSYSKMHRAEAEVVEAGTAEMLGDDEAIAMLTRAARSLDDVIQYVESVLKRLPAEQVAEAIAITREGARATGEKSRNGSNQAVQLIAIRLRANNLMLRVMKILKPDLAKQMAKA